ncbi:helix-turn-helix domain-containing protein [Sphingomonas colocasiae]|uniref:Helix-turn-helix domain-containing protein n=1 Tax=Sphingomonas colocasiae TaxID=1848973 RepID=A0ABS7PPW6_9SPHN|nr:helix-turn-helix domain-containing protein [Sphingomonas colocasiae]MBY8823281.1 helix-turn-helix domain-containing protein [Sphingomonas colocasiae]
MKIKARRDAKSSRLSMAVQGVLVADSDVRVRKADNSALEKPQRAIRYANPATALRKHVAQVQKLGTPPRFRVKLRPEPANSPEEELARSLPRAAAPISAREAHVPFTSPSAQSEGLLRIEAVAALGEMIRQVRRRRELSQIELAAMAGTGRRFISEVEAGKPTVEFGRLLSVCEALGIDLLATARR